MSPNAARRARRPAQRKDAVLPRSFYARETEHVARDLLGCLLESHDDAGLTSGRIVETEAYVGEHDLACHAAAGRTKRTAPLYGPPGMSYVYFIYGVHWCFNAVTREAGLPSAVLVRALEPVEGLDIMRERRPAARRDVDLTNGPGKLCAALGIGPHHNAIPLDGPTLVVRKGIDVPRGRVRVSPRIGISRCEDWPLRWFIADNSYVSRTPSTFDVREADR